MQMNATYILLACQLAAIKWSQKYSELEKLYYKNKLGCAASAKPIFCADFYNKHKN